MGDCLELAAAKLYFEVHPSKSNQILAGVREQLNQMLLRNNERFGAVPLAYFNETLVGTKAPILVSLPYINVEVKVLLMLFRPIIDHPLEGVVNKVGVDHLGVLVLGVFNASIGIDSTDGVFEHSARDPEVPCWRAVNNQEHRIAVGSTVRFVMSARREVDNMISLQGRIGEEGTGNVDFVISQGGDRKKKSKEKDRRKEKKSKHREENGHAEVTPKQKKKRKHDDQATRDSNEDGTPGASSSKKRGKKQKTQE